MELEKTIAMLLAGTALAAAPVLAQEVGTAAAVNPDSQSTPPGGSTTTLKVGARVVHKERIKTTPTGSVQLLFLDRSTLSIAPNRIPPAMASAAKPRLSCSPSHR